MELLLVPIRMLQKLNTPHVPFLILEKPRLDCGY